MNSFCTIDPWKVNFQNYFSFTVTTNWTKRTLTFINLIKSFGFQKMFSWPSEVRCLFWLDRSAYRLSTHVISTRVYRSPCSLESTYLVRSDVFARFFICLPIQNGGCIVSIFQIYGHRVRSAVHRSTRK